jgi:hypothetical protein
VGVGNSQIWLNTQVYAIILGTNLTYEIFTIPSHKKADQTVERKYFSSKGIGGLI